VCSIRYRSFGPGPEFSILLCCTRHSPEIGNNSIFINGLQSKTECSIDAALAHTFRGTLPMERLLRILFLLIALSPIAWTELLDHPGTPERISSESREPSYACQNRSRAVDSETRDCRCYPGVGATLPQPYGRAGSCLRALMLASNGESRSLTRQTLHQAPRMIPTSRGGRLQSDRDKQLRVRCRSNAQKQDRTSQSARDRTRAFNLVRLPRSFELACWERPRGLQSLCMPVVGPTPFAVMKSSQTNPTCQTISGADI
jgi:hypothetical protein